MFENKENLELNTHKDFMDDQHEKGLANSNYNANYYNTYD